MRVAISNLAWDPVEDEAVAALLTRLGVDAIDVAPGKYLPEPAEASAADIRRVREGWADRGIAITGMQALLFGTQGLNLFAEPAVQRAMLEHLKLIARIGAGLGGVRLVFGSPRNRDRSGLGDAEAEERAVDFFRRLGAIAEAEGVVFCLEPNPQRYGCNFMRTADETAWIVRRVAHPAIRMQLDTGALTINGEDAARVLAEHSDLVGHVHASEPDLVTLGDGGTPHERLAPLIAHYLPEQVVAIEMLPSTTEPHLAAIERAVEIAQRCYGRASTSPAA